ncbi:MAG: aminoglycoside phosphotransferase, partial [Spartobacteria bacterium]|nr:aminoglycoside phosphotransferase [Spartobacteria bacterium]
HESWMVRRALYESALDEIAKLHRIQETESQGIRDKLSAEFNAALYLWEQSYFFENCLGRYFKMDQARLSKLAILPALQEMAEELDHLPRVLVHRDFQSQNIIIRNGLAYLIDFQGMRPGLAEYDLASLLYDPYVALTDKERSELIEYYVSGQQEHGGSVAKDFKRLLALCAIQRLMQALGAYGFLGLVKRHKAFLKHIPAAMDSLRGIVAREPGLKPLDRALAELIS